MRRIDLCVGLAIGFMSTLLLLPVLAQGRDGDQRRRSQNNLKQIALAIHNYNDANLGKLPPLTDITPNAPNGAGLNSVFFNILPYIEQDNLYRVFKKSTESYCGAGGAAATIVKTYISPADATAPAGTTAKVKVKVPEVLAPYKSEFEGTYATTSYAANGMVFGSNKGGLPRTFVDGTSNTIMFGERAQVCGGGKPASGDSDTGTEIPVVFNLWAFGSYGPSTPSYALLTPTAPEKLDSTEQVAPVTPLPTNWNKGKIPVRIGRTIAPVTVEPPQGVPFQVAVGKDKNPCKPGLLQTPHTQGMLAALGDGSVRTISPKISQWTFWAATTPAGNETLYSDW